MAIKTEISFTDPQSIIDATLVKISEFKDIKDVLNRAAIKYVNDYDKINMLLKDGTLLRERMKDTVIKAVGDEF